MKAGKLKEIEQEPPGEPPSGPGEGQVSDPGPKRPYSMFPGKVTLGNMELECHVLNDLRRVLTQREVVRAISNGRESGNLGPS